MISNRHESALDATIEGVRRYCRRLQLAGVPERRASEIESEMLASLEQKKDGRTLGRPLGRA